jgi:hypothetical protein
MSGRGRVAISALVAAGVLSLVGADPSPAQSTAAPAPLPSSSQPSAAASTAAPPAAAAEVVLPTPKARKTKWENAKSKGDANVAAQAACQEIFAGQPGVQTVFGGAAQGNDLAGWKFANDKAVRKQLKARGAKDSVALCWVDVADPNTAGGFQRALYAVDPDQEPELIAVGDSRDISLTHPRYKNVPNPKAEPRMPDDITVPIVEWGPEEQAAAERIRNSKQAPPVTVVREDDATPVPTVAPPAKLKRRKLTDLEAEAKVRNKANFVKQDPTRTVVTTSAAATPTAPAPTTSVTVPTATTSPTSSISSLTTTTTPSSSNAAAAQPAVGEKQEVIRPGKTFKAGKKLAARNGRIYADALDGAEVSLAGDLSADELLAVAVGTKKLSFKRPFIADGTAVSDAEKVTGGSKGLPANSNGRKARQVAAVTDEAAASVSYADAFGPGVALGYEVLPDAVKETVVLTQAPSAAITLHFPFDTSGLKTEADPRGGYKFVDSSGATVFQIPAAFAFDSRGGANTPGNGYVNVPMDIVTDADGTTTLVLRPPLAWLQSPQRVYPVTIDPTVQLQPWNPMNLGYMPWGDNSGGSTFSAWTNDMLFGNWWGSQWRSYIQFDPTLFTGRTITNATLNLWVQNCDNQTTPSAPYANPIRVSRLTSGYFFGQAWSGPTFAESVSATPAGGTTQLSLNVTSFAQQWAANSATNLGVMLDMGASSGYCRVQRTAPGGQQTHIVVTYTDPTTTTTAPTTTAQPTTTVPQTIPTIPTPPIPPPPAIPPPVPNTGAGWFNTPPTNSGNVFTIHPMSSGQSRVQSQPNATELSRCLAVMPWNQSPLLSPTNQWPCTGPFANDGQTWRHWSFATNEFGSMYVQNLGDGGTCLNVAYASQAPGASVIAFPCQGGNHPEERWNYIPLWNGTFALQAVHSGQCLDVDGWGVAYWAGLAQWPCHHLGWGENRNQTFTAHGNGNPGHFMVAASVDNISVNGRGEVEARGWALTPQAPAQPLGIRLS